MTTAIIYHNDFSKHVTPDGHPESAIRIKAINNEIKKLSNQLPALPVLATKASVRHAAKVHDQTYITDLIKLGQSVKDDQFYYLDSDTVIYGCTSIDVARLAIGAGIQAVDMVMGNNCKNAFCAVRPPGHHAENNKAMGFCLFNNIAVTAQYLKDKYKFRRIAIVDFDVHHGNGTQQIFYNDPTVLYVSIHQSPLFPGTGKTSETGVGNIVNVPVAAGSDGQLYKSHFADIIRPALTDFAPEFVLVSAGFDAHINDPLANINLNEYDFWWLTRELCQLAGEYAKGRVVTMLEGGYDVKALVNSVKAHVRALTDNAM